MLRLKLPWRSLQVTINVATVITGFCSFMPLSYIGSYFASMCVLYADVRLSDVKETPPRITVDLKKSVWGTPETCRYTTFAPVIAAVHAFIWCWFFLLMKKQLKSEQKEFPLLVVSLLTHCVLLFTIFVVSGMISAGVDHWCRNLVREINIRHTVSHFVTCQETQNYNWTNMFQTKTANLYNFLLTAKISSWLQTLTLLCQVLVCGYKLYVWILKTDAFSLADCANFSGSTGTLNSAYSGTGDDDVRDDVTEAQAENNNGRGKLPEERRLLSASDVEIHVHVSPERRHSHSGTLIS